MGLCELDMFYEQELHPGTGLVSFIHFRKSRTIKAYSSHGFEQFVHMNMARFGLDYAVYPHHEIPDFGQWLFTDSSQRNGLHSECLPIREGTKEIIF